MLVTALSPKIGYDNAAISEEEFVKIFDPKKMRKPR